MKKFIALVVLFCAVMISSTTSAATMANWVFVNDFTVKIPYVPKCTQTPDQFYEDRYRDLRLQGVSRSNAQWIAGQDAQKYEDEYEAEQQKLQEPNIYKLWSSYIDTNSVVAEQTTDGSVAFCVLLKEIYTPAGIEVLSAYLSENKKPVPAGLEKLSFVVRKIHFKSPDGITKYYAVSDRKAFTTDGMQIEGLALSNASLNWTFIKPDENFDAIFDAAYKFLR